MHRVAHALAHLVRLGLRVRLRLRLRHRLRLRVKLRLRLRVTLRLRLRLSHLVEAEQLHVLEEPAAPARLDIGARGQRRPRRRGTHAEGAGAVSAGAENEPSAARRDA